jgi:NADH-quinone oxidoreductase subunit N
MQPVDLITALPEIFLAVAATTLLMVGAFSGRGALRIVLIGAVVVLAITMALIVVGPAGGSKAFGGLFLREAYSDFMKVLVLLGAGLTMVMSLHFLEREEMARFEFPVLMLFATLGMMIMISAGDLLSLYMGLELQSLSLYVVAAFRRDELRSSEAGLKYFVLGALSSGMLLYGCSLIYGFTGTTSFAGLATVLGAGEGAASIGLIVGLVFLTAGLAFKVSAVPFHMWTPDVYEGAPTPVTAFFATAPKVAALALFMRVMMGPFGDLVAQWQQIIVFISIASMVLGALAAIAQTNIKRLMAYSSIGHVGFALVGLAAGTEEGVRAGGACRRNRGGCARRRHLPGHLCLHERRHLRLHIIDAPGRPHGRRDRRPQGPRQDRPVDGRGFGHLHVLDGGHSAARRLLRQALRLHGGNRRRAL